MADPVNYSYNGIVRWAKNLDGITNDITAKTAATLATARTLTIKDSSNTNAGSAVSFNGGSNIVLNLPAIIKASITGNCSGSSGSCTGNAATATKLATARTISLSGAVTGSGSFDGGGNLSIATRVSGGNTYLSENVYQETILERLRYTSYDGQYTDAWLRDNFKNKGDYSSGDTLYGKTILIRQGSCELECPNERILRLEWGTYFITSPQKLHVIHSFGQSFETSPAVFTTAILPTLVGKSIFDDNYLVIPTVISPSSCRFRIKDADTDNFATSKSNSVDQLFRGIFSYLAIGSKQNSYVYSTNRTLKS